jgi:hypothetical protein
MTDLPIDVPLASSNPSHSPSSNAHELSIATGTVARQHGSSRRLGRRRLARLAAGLSERDKAMLRSVAELRLVMSQHLETLHFADAATPLTAARKARRRLQRLVQLGLLRRLERRIGGLHAGSAGFIYAITAAGQRVLELSPTARQLQPTWPFVAHTLDVADLYVALVQATRQPNEDCQLLDLQTEPQCWRRWTTLTGSAEVLKPDLYLALAVGADEVRWFIEVDRGSEHAPVLVRKARAYQRYYERGIEQERDGVFPRVAWVVPDAVRANQLARALATARGLTAELFAVVLNGDAVKELTT